MKVMLCYILLWAVMLSFVLNEISTVSVRKGTRDTVAPGVAASGKWYPLSR